MTTTFKATFVTTEKKHKIPQKFKLTTEMEAEQQKMSLKEHFPGT